MCKDLKLWMPECIYYFRHTAAMPNDKNYPFYQDTDLIKEGDNPVLFKLLEAGKMHPVGNTDMIYAYPDLQSKNGFTKWQNGLTSFLDETKGKGVCLTYPSY